MDPFMLALLAGGLGGGGGLLGGLGAGAAAAGGGLGTLGTLGVIAPSIIGALTQASGNPKTRRIGNSISQLSALPFLLQGLQGPTVEKTPGRMGTLSTTQDVGRFVGSGFPTPGQADLFGGVGPII